MGLFYCLYCGGNHPTGMHDYLRKPPEERLPIETPPHNGEYQGTVPVRVIPPGVSAGEEAYGSFSIARVKNIEKQNILRASYQLACKRCGKPRERGKKTGVYCSNECRRLDRPSVRVKRMHRPTKW